MTQEQEGRIKQAWAKLRATRERIRRAGEAIKSASLSGSTDRLEKSHREYDAANQADSAAQAELEAAMRDAGLNI
ncbi:MAG TPA: hypothetical protein VFX06_17055 [Stellaceae bacterium]|nr:hypothetical protein [Stellaceae bacterium]